MLKLRKCESCGSRYRPARTWQRYDSDACRMVAYQQRERARIRAEILAELASAKKARRIQG